MADISTRELVIRIDERMNEALRKIDGLATKEAVEDVKERVESLEASRRYIGGSALVSLIGAPLAVLIAWYGRGS